MINPSELNKPINSLFKWFGALWIGSLLIALAVLAGAGYVAIHFLSKFW